MKCNTVERRGCYLLLGVYTMAAQSESKPAMLKLKKRKVTF